MKKNHETIDKLTDLLTNEYVLFYGMCVSQKCDTIVSDINIMISSIFQMFLAEAVAQRCSVNKLFFKISQILQESTCARISFLIMLQADSLSFIKKETLAHVFSCKFYEIFKSTFFWRHTSGGCFCSDSLRFWRIFTKKFYSASCI